MSKQQIVFFLCCLLLPFSVFAQAINTKPRKTFIVFPVISRSIETGWAFGAAGAFTLKQNSQDTGTRTSNVQSLLLYSLKKQLVLGINGTIYFPGEKYILSGQLSLSSFPDKFWGIGNNTPDKNVEPYTFRQGYIYPHLQRAIARHVFLGILYEYQNVFKINYLHDLLFDQQHVAGRYSYKISGLGMSLTYDNRNHAFVPGKGALLQFTYNHFGKYLGSDYKYTNYVIDLRKFITVYRSQVLALQAYGFLNSGNEVPLRSLASFGGSNSMRGYYDGRYRDRNQIVLQAEYRIPIYQRFGAVIFGDAGDVGNSLKQFSLPGLKYSYGLGARVMLSKSEKLNLRIDYGIGQGSSHGFYFQLAEAF